MLLVNKLEIVVHWTTPDQYFNVEFFVNADFCLFRAHSIRGQMQE